MSKTIAVACHKGGVGKTTTVASLAGILAGSGQRVLVVDLDPQKNVTLTFTDGEFERTIYDVFKAFRSGRRGYVPDLPIYNVRDGLDIVPSSVKMFTVDSEVAGEMDKANILRKSLAKVAGDYDWVLVDCPAQLGVATANALIAAGNVLVPMTCDAYSVEGLKQMEAFLDNCASLNPDIELLGIVITLFRPRRRVDRELSARIDAYWKDAMFKTRIKECAELVKAPFVKKDIVSFNPRCQGAIDYTELAKEVIERVDNQ